MTDVIEKPIQISKKGFKRPSNRYIQLCARLGVTPAALKEIKLKAFLFDNEISLYDLKQVENYLLRTSRGRHRVSWQPLIENGDGVAYQQLVPERVLLLVEKLSDAFPDSKFFVSYVEDLPDPFAAISVGTGELFVFAVWDEPGFSG